MCLSLMIDSMFHSVAAAALPSLSASLLTLPHLTGVDKQGSMFIHVNEPQGWREGTVGDSGLVPSVYMSTL